MRKLTVITILLSLGIVWSCGSKKSSENDQTDSTNQAQQTEQVEINIVGKEVTYSTDSVDMKGYIAYNENAEGKVPGILVVHEWWGHNEHARKRADMLAELGYVALAVDMYGGGKQASHPDDAGKFATRVMTNMESTKARFEAAMEKLKQNEKVDPDKIGAIGFCMGGSVVLSMANAGYDLDAVAAFHAGIQLPVWPEKNAVKGKILVANGAEDPMVKAEHVANFKAKMDSAGADYQYFSYEGAVHAYTNKNADSVTQKYEKLKGALSYNAEADSASWEEMKKLFDEAF